MIEKYFLTGARFKWQCPAIDESGSKDGSIVNSPNVIANPMTYDGQDGGLYNAGNPHTTSVGLTMRMMIPYNWLVYKPGHTTRRLLMAGDVLTGPMTGCPIIEWTERGQRWVGHIGTTESAAINSRVKNTFGIAMPTQARGFNPDAAWQPNDIADLQRQIHPDMRPRARKVALVTSSSVFYSILMFEFLQTVLPNGQKMASRDYWCVGGIKRVPPMNAMELRRWLLS